MHLVVEVDWFVLVDTFFVSHFPRRQFLAKNIFKLIGRYGWYRNWNSSNTSMGRNLERLYGTGVRINEGLFKKANSPDSKLKSANGHFKINFELVLNLIQNWNLESTWPLLRTDCNLTPFLNWPWTWFWTHQIWSFVIEWSWKIEVTNIANIFFTKNLAYLESQKLFPSGHIIHVKCL